MENKYVFISYSSANKGIADATCHILEKCGIPCWIAPRNIIPGKTWAGNIVQAIRDCSLMVLIYSEDSNSSSQVANEVDKAFSHGKIIIPFMVDSTPMNDDFDYYLSRKHWLVAYPDYKKMLMPLVEAVATNIGIEIQRPQSKVSNSISRKEVTAAIPQYEVAIETARKLLLNYEHDTAFAELIRPALDDYKEAQFLVRTILTTYSRMQRLNAFRFKYVKEKADSGNAFAQYMMCRYYTHIERNEGEAYRYANLCAAQGKSYGYLELSMAYEFATSVERSYLRAHELLDKAVNMDDPFAMMRLAKDNLYGWTRKRNPKRAFMLLKQCMEIGIPESFEVMGNMYNEGDGVECDRKRALELYQRALDEGYLEAYNSMAWYYLVNMETFQYRDDAEIQQGISLLRKGIEYGVAMCLSTLAYCHQEGIGVLKKTEQAFRWYKKAAEAGDPGSYFNIGCMYYYGNGCQENNAEAWKWFIRGSQIPFGSCFYQLGLMCQEGYGQDGKTVADCVDYYEESLRIGGGYASESALRLYNIFRTRPLETNPLMRDDENTYYYDWAPKDNHRAVNYLKQAAGMSDYSPKIYFKYGAILCTEGHGFTDEFEGIRYLKLAVEKGEPRAAVMLAQIYEKGELADKDLEKAREYYQLAADKDCGDGYVGLAKGLCSQIMGTIDEPDGELPDIDKATKQKLIGQAYEYVCQADKLGCKAVCPLEETISAFMLEDELLTPAERNHLVEMNNKYARLGNLQCIVDRGVMFHIGRLTKPDVNKAIEAYQQAARLDKECAAKNLGDLYSGKEESLPAERQDKSTAAYWYEKDSSKDSQAISARLREEGHQVVINSEHVFYEKKRSEHIKWIFPYLCDPAFTSASSKLRIFEWANFAKGPLAEGIPQNADTDVRYLPKELNDLFKAYVKLYNLLSKTYGWSNSLLPRLSKDDFFPYLSMPHLLEITQMVYRAWNAHVKHGKDKWLQQQATKVEQITLMRQDWEFILDFAEKCPDNDLQLLLISVVDMCYGLEALAELYWQLIALNDLVENAENANFHLPESFVKKMADLFFDGTDVLPRSRTVARRLYAQIPYLPGVEEKLKQ